MKILALPLLVLLSGLGAWLLHGELMPAAAISDAEGERPAVADLPAMADHRLAPLASFNAIIERPLFSSTRRPPAVQDVGPEESKAMALDLDLQGILLAGAARVAVLRDRKSGALLHLKRNQIWRGWRLATIGRESVTFCPEPRKTAFRFGFHGQTRGKRYRAAPPVQQPTSKRAHSSGRGGGRSVASGVAKQPPRAPPARIRSRTIDMPKAAAIDTLSACALCIFGVLSLMLAGCETPSQRQSNAGITAPAPAPPLTQSPPTVTTPPPISYARAELAPDQPPRSPPPLVGPEFYPGTGSFTGPGPLGGEAAIGTAGGRVTLNFVNAEVRELVDVVLGETLRANYVIDPAVQGQVTLRTSQPLPRDAVVPILSDVLAMNGATISLEDGIYRIVPRATAGGGLAAPIISPGIRRLAQGYGVNVLPLDFVSAREVFTVVQPFVSPGALTVNETRNLLLFTGSASDARDLEAMVRLFDVDWMAGLSFALLPVETASASELVGELEAIFAQEGEGPTSGVLRFLAIERLNAVLAISPQSIYLERARLWVERLDRGGQSAGRQIFVYYVENGRAADLAETLGRIFEPGRRRQERDRNRRLAPGLVPVELASEEADVVGSSTLAVIDDDASSRRDPEFLTEPIEVGIGQAVAREFDGGGEIRIIADEAANALLVLAKPAEYRMIEATLKRLDLVPLQVLIEATIAEVTLVDDLRYGLNWFFQQGDVSATFSSFTNGAIAQAFPGFSFLINTNEAAVVLNALTEITDINVISSPQLMVLDNEQARLQVGDQVPVATQSAVSVIDAGAPVVNSIQLVDTGVVLEVTPRVNAGGLVRLEISQEVSTPITTTTSDLNSPTIQQRQVESTVVVQSGETVALGGLIIDNQTKSVSGVPGLSAIPLLGHLFKTTAEAVDRTELLILITPRVVRNTGEARAVTQELRQRLTTIAPLENKIRKTIQQ